MTIDTSFDFRSDARGKDPDSDSPTLRRYHKTLWSKALPGGALFDLADTPGGLHHKSHVGEFFLTSDGIITTLKRSRAGPLVSTLPEADIETFETIGNTIGGRILFPGRMVDEKQTINHARGFHPKICDRFDLTLECIRRNYRGLGETNPLGEVLGRYGDFFELFVDFRGYVDFFLLQDLVTSDYSAVRFFIPFDDFGSSPLPKDVVTYQQYRRLSIEFIEARNRRIDALAL